LARDKAWTEFVDWCTGYRLRALPAHPWTVAAYVRWCERRRRHRTLARRLRAIARAHVLAGHKAPDRHPTVMRTLHAVETRRRNRARPLFRAEDFLLSTTPTPPIEAAASAKPTVGRALRNQPRLVRRRPKSD
jgi:hypothetical protein